VPKPEPTGRTTVLGIHRFGGRPIRSIAGSVCMIAALMLIWMTFSSMWDPFHLAAGLGSSILVTALTYWLLFQGVRRRAGKRDRVYYIFSFRWHHLPVFLPWLLWKITLANLQVAALILHPKMPIDPGVIRIKSGLHGDLSRMVLGAVITLTPGTCVLDIQGDEFVVHHIHPSTSTDLISGSMAAMVRRTFEYDESTQPAVDPEGSDDA
jgi:multicomponent Na+:H+ antiporter subunit E